MIDKLFDTIEEHNLIEYGESIIVGVSGGPDSVCLLHALYSLVDKLGIRIYAVHINHMLRDEEAKQDELYVRSLCDELGIPVFVEAHDIRSISGLNRISLEEAGREIRYHVFELYANKTGATKIAVAHNKNDQVETVLMHIIRGSGLDGLIGMEYKNGKIIRPLLGIKRCEIEDYCAEHMLSPRIDSSNLISLYTRNKIRIDLIPHIDTAFGTNLVDSVSRMSTLLRDDNEFIEESAENAYKQCIIKKEADFVSLDLPNFKKYPPAIKKRVVRNAIRWIKGDLKGIEKIHVTDAVELGLYGKTGAKIHLPGEIRVSKSYEVLSFLVGDGHSEYQRVDEPASIPGITHIPFSNMSVEAFIEKKVLSVEVYNNIRYNSLEQCFDYEQLNKGIYIRNRRNGDIFAPIKSNGTKKLKEYLIDNKVPREDRDKLLLVARQNEIVWIIGHKTSDKFKVTENTKTVLRLVYKKTDIEAWKNVKGVSHADGH